MALMQASFEQYKNTWLVRIRLCRFVEICVYRWGFVL